MPQYWIELAEKHLATGRWLITAEHAAAAMPWVRLLNQLGAEKPFVLSAWTIGGVLPTADEAELFLLDLPQQDTMMDGITVFENALEDLPDAAIEAIRKWDPKGCARIIGPFFARAKPIDGHTYLGGRPWSWQALEDKTIIDAIWDKIGIQRAPYLVVPPTVEALTQAAHAMNQGFGTVQAADSREGFHGAASLTRWVQTPQHQLEVQALFEPVSDQVRVMPFLEGTSCSIHGMVFPDLTLAFRPMEMVVLRQPQTSKFIYARASSFWDPPAEHREHMRTTAKRVGDYLRATYGFRGVFTIDGVMTAEGFRPVELNPRFGAALVVMVSSAKFALHLMFLNYLLIDGQDVQWRATELEKCIIELGDTHRAARVGFLHAPCTPPQHGVVLFLAPGPEGWHEVSEEEAAAEVRLDPSENGVLINIFFASQHTPLGQSVAPWTVEICAWLDARYTLQIGPLSAATELHS